MSKNEDGTSRIDRTPVKHRFRVGEQVYLRRRTGSSAAAGTYEVVRQMPSSASGFQYRIKSRLERTERVADESDLMRGVGSE